MTAAQPERRERIPVYNWYALGVLALVYCTNFIDRQILSILANDIKADLAISDAQLGFLYGTAFAVFYALLGIPLGRLADSTHRLRLLSFGLALWSAMTVLSGLARNYAQLALARVGVGVGEASANPSAYSLIADWFPAHMRARAIAIYSAGLFVGSGLSLWLGGFIVEGWTRAFPTNPPLGLAGWQAAFIVVGLPGLVLAAWLLTLREPERGKTAESAGAFRTFFAQCALMVPPFALISAAREGGRALAVNLSGAALIALICAALALWLGNVEQFVLIGIAYYAVFSWVSHTRRADPECHVQTWGSGAFLAIVGIYACTSYVGYSVTYWAAPYAERTFALGKAELGLLIGAPNAVGGFLGILAGGWAADALLRYTANGRVLVASAAVVLPVPLVLIGYTTENQTLFLACNFLTQFATASALGACASASQALVDERMRGRASALFLLGPTLVGLCFGPFAVGLVSERTGDLGLGVMMSLLAAIPAGVCLIAGLRLYPEAAARVAS
tara:strand:- start:3285 stop:4799 length:1515 start_codon:yes stop_codon:yes gene_type:complete